MRSFVTSPENATSAPPPSTEDTTPKGTALPARHSPSVYVDGEVTTSDLKMPYLSCVHNVGPKSVLFTPGTLVLGEVALTEAPKPQEPTPRLRVLFAKVNKIYMENLPYTTAPTAARPRIFATEEQVKQAGGTLKYAGNIAPSFIPKATCLALLRAPKNFEDDPQFSIIDNEKVYTPVMISFQKTSYPAAKTLFTDLSLSLRQDPTATFYDLFWVRELKGSNWVWVAKLVRVRDDKPSDALRDQAKKFAGTNVEVVDDEAAD